MLTLEMAQLLRDKGVRWTPAPGDRFVIPDRGMDDEIFVISDMTVEVHDVPTGRLIGFNGTTEWALDSVQQGEVVWLPRESQLRELLGTSFVRLEALPDGFAVVVERHGAQQRYVDSDCEQAYAHGLLAVIGR